MSATELDPNLRNNQASLTTAVSVPALTIQDTSVVEGDGATTYAVFLLTLSQPATQPIQVDYFTTNGTALAGADYTAQTNRLTFLAGEISRTIEVPILGDVLDENDETFQVVLANPVNAELTKAVAMATILDDDPMPTVSIGDAAVVEGNAGTTNTVFPLSLSQASGRPVSVSFTTANGTALAGQDYSARTNVVVVFAPGQTVTNLSIAVNGDLQVEADETFFVVLGSPVNATLGKGSGTGTIVSDDLAPLVQAVGWRMVAERGGLTNGVLDPGELVTLSVALLNNGSQATTNLTATLAASGRVVSPGAAQSYGALSAGGPAVSRPFSFVVGGGNCSTLTCTLALSDGDRDLGTATLNLRVGNCFYDDFDPGIDLTLWSAFGGTVGSTVLATNYGGYVSAPNSLWFGDAGSRFATTCPLNTALGGTVSFQLRIASGSLSTWEMADLPGEGIVLEYSSNSGASWSLMGGYTNSIYTSWTAITEAMPLAAQGTAVQFRWRQLSHSGTGYDHWALDNVMIATGPQPPAIQTQPRSLTVRPGTNVVLTVVASGSSPLSFQWRRGGTNLVNGGRISGATTPTLSIVSATEADSESYTVVVSNAYGVVTSDAAVVEVSWLDHFTWDWIDSPQGAGLAFPARV
ncbi:MAG TPA: Calx-beta domain-containing protein, partial [Candidatus Sulfotelmatobacter sp.]|nr:Calx-beta domain-containing protein [Candidatus Sulfotelmatobacter sp.]